MILIYVFVAVICLIYFYCKKQRPSNYPPGPIPLPIIGNLHQLGPYLHTEFYELSKKYGPIVSVDLGLNKAIAVHGAKLIKEAFNEISMSGRPKTEAVELVVGDRNGIIFGEGDAWVEQRRFSLRHLRDFGFGKNAMEELMLIEVNEVLDWIKKQNGKPVSLHRRFSLAVINSLWTIISGERYNHDDPKLVNILEGLEASGNTVFQYSSIKNKLIFFYPAIAKLIGNWSGWNRLVEINKERIGMFERIVTEHKRTLPEGAAHPRDFVDVFLQEVKKTNNPNSSFHWSKSDKTLISIIGNLFAGGADTSSTTLNWIMLYLLHNPEVQAKMQNELDFVVGNSRLPSLTDRKNTPYCEAVIAETLRLSSIAPTSVPHFTLEDTQFHGYTIPKGTTIYGNLWAAHRDPEIWGDPEIFRPDRFLSIDGKTAQRHESLIPFSIGRRVCPGETLARDTVYLFTTCIVQQFYLLFESGKPKPTFDVRHTLTLAPQPYKLIMRERI